MLSFQIVVLLAQKWQFRRVSDFQTSAVHRRSSIFPDPYRWKAAVWPQKAEVCEGASKGAEEFLVGFKELKVLLSAIDDHRFNGLRSKILLSLRA